LSVLDLPRSQRDGSFGAMTSLFVRIGGEAAVVAAVDLLYKKFVEDPLLAPFFNELDLAAQLQKLVGFMGWAFGAEHLYSGRDLGEAHARLVRERGLTDVHFDAVVIHLGAALRELGVADDLVAEALTIVDGVRGQVLRG
jgi:hemoglobin